MWQGIRQMKRKFKLQSMHVWKNVSCLLRRTFCHGRWNFTPKYIFFLAHQLEKHLNFELLRIVSIWGCKQHKFIVKELCIKKILEHVFLRRRRLPHCTLGHTFELPKVTHLSVFWRDILALLLSRPSWPRNIAVSY